MEDYDVKSFGSSVPAIVMNPNSNPVKLPEIASGKLGEIKPPRYKRGLLMLLLLVCSDMEFILLS